MNYPPKNYLYRILFENYQETYFIILTNVFQKNYKTLRMLLINLEKELMEYY